MLMLQLSILIVVVVTQGYTWENCIEVHTHTHTQMSTYITVEIWIGSMNCNNINFLVLILYYSCISCYHWEKLGEEYIELLCIFLCNFLWIYNYYKLKKNFKMINWSLSYYQGVIRGYIYLLCNMPDSRDFKYHKNNFIYILLPLSYLWFFKKSASKVQRTKILL